MYKKTIFLILFTFCMQQCFAQQPPYGEGVSNVGTTAASFLEIGIGSRAVAMGGAFTAIADDATSLYWNPAGLALCHRPQIIKSHNDWFLDIFQDYFGAVLPLGSHNLGVSINYLAVPDQEVRSIDQPEGTGLFYNSSDLMLGLSYAFRFTDQFSLGTTVKYIHQKIYYCSASAVALDFGAMYEPSIIPWLRLGMQIANFGMDMQMNGRNLDLFVDTDDSHNSNDRIPAGLKTDKYALPLVFRFGLATYALDTQKQTLFFSADLIHPANNTESINFGAEYVFRGMFALRGGYNALFERDYSHTGGLCLGAGINVYIKGTVFKLDYAYHYFGILQTNNRFSIGVGF
ncbi:PorV/PorQ family protein [candidate division KSB1 bacterium]|nr:PorV/PorQ family protein [candidate division KSB1 bacterium]